MVGVENSNWSLASSSYYELGRLDFLLGTAVPLHKLPLMRDVNSALSAYSFLSNEISSKQDFSLLLQSMIPPRSRGWKFPHLSFNLLQTGTCSTGLVPLEHSRTPCPPLPFDFFKKCGRFKLTLKHSSSFNPFTVISFHFARDEESVGS